MPATRLLSAMVATWNNVATTFTGIKLNVTNTASAAASLLIDLQVDAVSKFKVRKDGLATYLAATLGSAGNFLLEVAAHGPMISKTDGGNVLSLRNQSSAQYSISSVTFRDSSASHSGTGIETMALGYDNGGTNDPFSNVNFIEMSNDPEAGVTTNLPKEFRIIQTGYQNAEYKARMRFKLAGDGTATWYDITNGYSTPGAVLMAMPALTTGVGSFGYGFGIPYGAVGAPSIFFTGTATTGIWSSGSNTINFAANGLGVAAVQTTGFQVGSGKMLYDVATATAPVFLPQQGDTKAGIGGTSGNVSIIANNGGTATEIFRATGTTAQSFAAFSAPSVTTSATDFIHKTSAALANAAAAEVATMTNGPVAGNPTKWIAISDNGTTRYIPCW